MFSDSHTIRMMYEVILSLLIATMDFSQVVRFIFILSFIIRSLVIYIYIIYIYIYIYIYISFTLCTAH